MLKFLPSDALLEAAHGGWPSKFYSCNDWFMVYEYLCRRMLEVKKYKFEALNTTSSINNSSFDKIWNCDVPLKRIAYLFSHNMGFWLRETSPFLKLLGIRKWSDLDKPIYIIGRRPKLFPNQEWFKMQGRIFSYSPNNCHPKAKWVDGFGLKFCHHNKRWQAMINYDYKHGGGSTWMVTLEQKYGEHLDSFAKRIDAWIAEQLKPEAPNGQLYRDSDERTWQRVYAACRDLFHDDPMMPDFEDEIADLLVKIDGSSLTKGRILINKQRLSTIKKWVRLTKLRRK